jgi:hypothetical protein
MRLKKKKKKKRVRAEGAENAEGERRRNGVSSQSYTSPWLTR